MMKLPLGHNRAFHGEYVQASLGQFRVQTPTGNSRVGTEFTALLRRGIQLAINMVTFRLCPCRHEAYRLSSGCLRRHT